MFDLTKGNIYDIILHDSERAPLIFWDCCLRDIQEGANAVEYVFSDCTPIEGKYEKTAEMRADGTYVKPCITLDMEIMESINTDAAVKEFIDKYASYEEVPKLKYAGVTIPVEVKCLDSDKKFLKCELKLLVPKVS